MTAVNLRYEIDIEDVDLIYRVSAFDTHTGKEITWDIDDAGMIDFLEGGEDNHYQAARKWWNMSWIERKEQIEENFLQSR